MKRRYGLIGHPLGHSISSQIHTEFYRRYQMDAEYIHYDRTPEKLAELMAEFRKTRIAGFNITIPYKTDVIPFLAALEGDAGHFGAVNTVLNRGGDFIGYNTDGVGFIKLLQKHEVMVRGKSFLILGAGGAAKALACKLALEKACKVIILNRTLDRAESLARAVSSLSSTEAICGGLEDFDIYAGSCHCIINTTSVGMSPHINAAPVEGVTRICPETAVVDIIYNPSRTKFLQLAASKGCKTVNGLGMLIYQAMCAFEIWTGIAPDDDFEEELEKKLKIY